MQPNQFFLLPFQFEVAALLSDLAICQQQAWILHFNQKDYLGEWTSISLRSKSGKANDIFAISSESDDYQPTELLANCAYFQEVISHFKAPLESVRLLNLMPNSEIKTHIDQGCGYEHGVFRLHIPITTDEKVDFIVAGKRLEMEAGSCWYANFNLPHSVCHSGTQPRIHLIIDGIRNEWSDKLFEEVGYDFEWEKKQKEPSLATKRQMLIHLKEMNSEAAKSLIAQLEQELS